MHNNEQNKVSLRHDGFETEQNHTKSEYVEEENMRGVAEVAYNTIRGCSEAFEAGKQRVEMTTY